MHTGQVGQSIMLLYNNTVFWLSISVVIDKKGEGIYYINYMERGGENISFLELWEFLPQPSQK